MILPSFVAGYALSPIDLIPDFIPVVGYLDELILLPLGIWLVALATYEPTDPVWFFSAGLGTQSENFAGRVGAFLAELSFQLVGHASYLIPAAMVVVAVVMGAPG